uniref:Uncharacterized protein n=1 Tax=Myoviridae sp. ctuev19 TaxID=2827716 RepID=A0A8S5SFM9_9CAUD|nr:MAG TPA: hypothetical protein [Myoviridae sp. ctuev19]DAQ81063.1 MAG TPA: hypothetical protein [Caudoviricetes sp.]
MVRAHHFFNSLITERANRFFNSPIIRRRAGLPSLVAIKLDSANFILQG